MSYFEDSNLHKLPWTTEISDDINKVHSTEFIASNIPDGRLKVTNTGRLAMAGGLVTCKRPLPQFPPGTFLSYVRLSTLFMIPKYSLFNIGRLEFDGIFVLKAAPNSTTPIANRFNGSTQLNFTTGMIEIDASSGSPVWTPVAPIPIITADGTYKYAVCYFLDQVNNTITVQSITIGTQVIPINKTTGAQTSNWGLVAAVQKQNEMFNPGSTEVIYDQTQLEYQDTSF